MSNNLGPIDVEFLLNNPEFTANSNKIKREMQDITSTAQQETDKAAQLYKRLGTSIAAYFSLQAIQNFGREVINVTGEFQQLDVSLKTILGSKDEADRLLAQVVDLAAKTPFSLTELAEGSKLLLAYQFESEEVTETLRRLGDVASGLNIPFNELNMLYGKSRVEGRLFAEDLNQFTGRGIPMIQELATVMGVAESEVRKLVTAGKVGFPEVEQAIKNMTSEGGAFFNLMEAQMQTIVGKISNLGDAFDRMYNDIGSGQAGLITDTLDGLISLVDNYEEVLNVLKLLVVTYGGYRAAIILTSVATKALAAANKGYTVSQILTHKWTVLATRAQKILNATMLANPYVAAATALTALVGALVIYNDKASESVTISEDFKRNIQDEVKAINDLFLPLKKAGEGTLERKKALEDINTAYGQYLPNQLTEKSNLEEIETAQKAVNVAIAESIFLRSQESDLQAVRDSSTKLAEEMQKSIAAVAQGANFDASLTGRFTARIEEEINRLAQFASVSADNFRSEFSKIFREFNIDFSVLGSGDEVSTWTLENFLQSSMKYRNALNSEQTTIEQLEAAKQGYLEGLGLLSKGNDNNTETVEEQIITLAKLKEELQALQQYRDTIAEGDLAEFERNEQEIIALQKRIAAREIESAKERGKERKKTELELLKQTLDDKRAAYENYYEAIKILGKDSAEMLFKDLLKEGETYASYLEKTLAGIDPTSKDAGGKTVLVNRELSRATGQLSPLEMLEQEIEDMKKAFADFETYKQQYGIAAAKQQYASLLNEYDTYLDFVRQRTIDNADAFASVLAGTATGDDKGIAKLLENEKSDAQRSAQLAYEAELAALQDYQTKRAKLISDFEIKKQEYIEAGNLRAAAQLQAAHEEELGQLDDANLKKLASYQSLFDRAIALTVRKGEELIQQTIAMLANENMSPQLRKELEEFLVFLQQSVNNLKRDKILAIADGFDRLGASIATLGQSNGSGALREMGGLINALAGSVRDINTMFDNTATEADKIQAGFSGLIKVIDMLASASARRREAERRYYEEMIGLQQQYNISLNDQLRLEAELGESVFLKDYEGRVKSGLDSVLAASNAQQEELAKLQNGMAKVGQKNGVDWKNVGIGAGGGAAAGAAAGALLGSVVPVVGTIIGGIAGGLLGIFGGKSKKDQFSNILELYPTLVERTESGLLKVNKALAESLRDNNQLNDETKQIVDNILQWEEQIEKAREQVRGVVAELVGNLGPGIRNSLVEAFMAGEDAGVAMAGNVGKALEDMVTQLLFNRIFADAFQKLEDQIVDDLAIGDIEGLNKTFGDFYKQSQALAGQFSVALNAAREAAKKQGLDILTPTEGSTGGIPGAIRREVTERTASELSGLWRAVYDLAKRQYALTETGINIDREHYQAMLVMIRHQAAIEKNTADTVAKLDDAITVLNKIDKNTKSSTARDLGY
ncbi:tape measure protein [Peijinzhouia sedimentorum]